MKQSPNVFNKPQVTRAIAVIIVSISSLVAKTVPFEDVSLVATAKAQSIWGHNLNTGPVIPYFDLNGEPLSYEFCYRNDGNIFPSTKELATERSTNPKWFKNYCHILVSARYDLYPIPACGEGLPSFFTRMDEAHDVAEKALNTQDIEFVGIQAIPFTPLDVFFVFQSNGQTVRVDPYKQEVVSPERLDQLRKDFCGDGQDSEAARENAESWQRMIESAISDQSYFMMPEDHYVEHWEFIEPLDWQYGCYPTAVAMALTYYEYGNTQYGKLLGEYFYRVDKAGSWNKKNYHVPKAQRMIAICLGTDTTDGSTSIYYDEPAGPLMRYTNDSCGYNFDAYWTVKGTSTNDFLWDSVIVEVNSNRPFVWLERTESEGHFVAAFGYTDNKYILLYDTWDEGVQRWYYKTYYSGDGSTEPLARCNITRIISGGGHGFNVHLLQPDGGQEWGNVNESTPGGNGEGEALTSGQTYPIKWSTDSLGVGYVKLYLSTNQGKTWKVITDRTGNDGEYEWEVTTNLVLANPADSGNRLCATDGSFGDFTIDQTTTSRIKIEAYTGNVGLEEETPRASCVITSFQIQNGSIDFSYDTPIPGSYAVSFYDVTGREVGRQNGNLENAGVITCMPKLTQGVYFWRFSTSNNQESSGKFVYLR